jgi:hypothetical protein
MLPQPPAQLACRSAQRAALYCSMTKISALPNAPRLASQQPGAQRLASSGTPRRAVFCAVPTTYPTGKLCNFHRDAQQYLDTRRWRSLARQSLSLRSP